MDAVVARVLAAVRGGRANHSSRRLRRRWRLRDLDPGRRAAGAGGRVRLADTRSSRRRLRAQRGQRRALGPARHLAAGHRSIAGSPPPGGRTGPADWAWRSSSPITTSRGDELPECLILHPAIERLSICRAVRAAVAWKLGCALRAASGQVPGAASAASSRGPWPDSATADLDLVALATVADVVPLVGENRSLVRRGLLRCGGLGDRGCGRCWRGRVRAEQTRRGRYRLRLGPRINAAGRLYRADAGVELFLTRETPAPRRSPPS